MLCKYLSSHIQPYTRSYLNITHLQDAKPNENNSMYVHIAQKIQVQFDSSFKMSRLQKFDVVRKEGGLIPSDRNNLPPKPSFICKHLFCHSKPLLRSIKYSKLFGQYWDIPNNLAMTFQMVLQC